MQCKAFNPHCRAEYQGPACTIFSIPPLWEISGVWILIAGSVQYPKNKMFLLLVIHGPVGLCMWVLLYRAVHDECINRLQIKLVKNMQWWNKMAKSYTAHIDLFNFRSLFINWNIPSSWQVCFTEAGVISYSLLVSFAINTGSSAAQVDPC